MSNIDPVDCYLPIDRIIKKIPNYMWQLVKKPKDLESWISTFIELKAPHGDIKYSVSKRGKIYRLYQMHVGSKLLRSSNEIYFYELLCDNGLCDIIDFEIERPYDSGKMKCDFYLVKGKKFIELLGYADEEYVQKMKYKEDTFDSILLRDKRDYKKFIDEYYNEYYDNCR